MGILQLIALFYRCILKAWPILSFFSLTLDGVQVWACEVSGLNLSLKLLCIVLKHHVGWEVKATRCWMEMKGEREGIQTEAGW